MHQHNEQSIKLKWKKNKKKNGALAKQHTSTNYERIIKLNQTIQKWW